jgi:multicomponent Na+:H+ antiporter subunit D
VLLALGLISMTVGALLAARQSDLKRLLAYSSISQVGYIMAGIGTGTAIGIAAALFHLFNHSIFKSLLFMNAGAVEYATGTRKMERLANLNSKMPVTGITSLIGSLSIAGIPPLNGFWSKLFIIMALFQAGFIKSGILAVAVSVLTLAYFLKVQKTVFFRRQELAEDPVDLDSVKEVPFLMQISMIILAAVCVIAGLYFLPLTKTVFEPAARALTDGFAYVKLVIPGG